MPSCPRCDAALDPAAAVCPRCGAAPAPAAAPAAGAPSATVKILAGVGMVVVGVAFGVMFFARMKPPEDAPPPRRPPGAAAGRGAASAGETPSRQGAPKLAVFLDDLCFADANGDGVPDPVVWMEGPERGRAAAADGRTGRGLWASPELEAPAALACAGGAVLAGTGDGTLRALDARTGAERWAKQLAGAAEQIAAGEGCATVLTKDGAATGLALDTGEPGACPSAPRPSPLSGPLWERKQNPQVVASGDVEVVLSAAVTGGAPLLAIEGRRAGASIWTKDLAARAPSGGARPDLFLVAAAGVVLTAAADAATGTELRLVGIDAATGAIRYERPAPYLRRHVAVMRASGPHVVAIGGGGLHALDPATGEPAWQAAAPATLP